MLAVSTICPGTCIGSSPRMCHIHSDNASVRFVHLTLHVSKEVMVGARASCIAILHQICCVLCPLQEMPV